MNREFRDVFRKYREKERELLREMGDLKVYSYYGNDEVLEILEQDSTHVLKLRYYTDMVRSNGDRVWESVGRWEKSAFRRIYDRRVLLSVFRIQKGQR